MPAPVREFLYRSVSRHEHLQIQPRVRFHAGGAITQSLVMRSHPGTVRMIEARHQMDKSAQISNIDYA